MAASGAFHARGFHPTAICGIFGAVTSVSRLGRARPGGDDERARDRRLLRGRPVRIPRRGDADEADASRLGGARGAPRDAPRGARRRRAGLGARGQVRPLPRLRRRGGGRGRHRRAAVRPRQPLGDAADRLQAVPGLPLHARLARRGERGRGGPDVRAGGDRGRARHRAGGGRLARARAGGREGGPPLGVRGQVLAPVLDRVAPRPRPRRRSRLHRRGDRRPGRARRRAEGAVRDEAVPDVPAGVPGGRRRAARGRDVVRGGLPAPEGRPGEPALARRGAREVPRQRLPRARRTPPSRRSRRRSSRSTSWTTSRPRSRRSTLTEAVPA